MKSEFTLKLMQWNLSQNKRSMPWKGEQDPYKIWLSEIILQQTRVEQGWAYYKSFIEAFPTIHNLAKAKEQKVFKLWEGLGYYSRCKNLHATAKTVVREYKGIFPTNYKDILALKGVGPYTAAAIASFAYNLPYAVVDGNVQRVISRYFGINTPVDTSNGKKLYAALADSLLDKETPGLYNQAIMDFGATICRPRNPLCHECVQKRDCQAFQHQWVDLLPVKEKVIERKIRWLTYYIIRFKDRVYIRKRNEKDIWANLFEFILRESPNQQMQTESTTSTIIQSIVGSSQFKIQSISPFFRQQLTHQTIHGQFVMVLIEKPLRNKAYELVPEVELNNYAFPKLINTYLEQR